MTNTLFIMKIFSIFVIDTININLIMNLQQLEYIVALDNHKSFSKAAESCFITQATLSTMVKKLEIELDIIIFDRKTNPIITTDEGKKIISEAKNVLFYSKRIKEITSEINSKVKGQIRIGIIPTVAGNLLHRILPVLISKYPDLELNIKEITTQNIINQLKTNDIDLGIVSTPLNLKTEFEETILYYEKLMLYGNFTSKAEAILNPNEIKNEKLWLLEESNCLTNQIINVCELKHKNINNNLNFYPNSFDSLINLVDQFNGLTLIPELYFLDLPNEQKKLVKNFTKPTPVREISIIYHRPYAKLKIIEVLSHEIKNIITPILTTSKLENKDLVIAKM